MNKYTVSHDEYVVSHKENKLLDFFYARKQMEVIKELFDVFHSMLCLIQHFNLKEIEQIRKGRFSFIGIICDFAMDFHVDRDLVDEHGLLSEDLYGKLHSLANMVGNLGSTEKNIWTEKAVRTEPEWKEIIELTAEINKQLKNSSKKKKK